ncbi:MAG: STAS domain-containing protein [Prolixibacteraceae bacterium]|jgi:anti-sigma B factor antagonist|nr:STAS domain-containing protein [Prolixibacteraceae bacterium]
MNITTQNTNDGILIRVEGRIDTTNYNEFENAVNEVVTGDTKQIYLDCSGLNYISSSGLRIFLTIQKKMMAAGGKLKLFAMQPAIREIFDISGFSSIFAIYPDQESAEQA